MYRLQDLAWQVLQDLPLSDRQRILVACDFEYVVRAWHDHGRIGSFPQIRMVVEKLLHGRGEAHPPFRTIANPQKRLQFERWWAGLASDGYS